MPKDLQEPIRAFMTKGVVSIDPDETVTHAAKKMTEFDIASLVVVKGYIPFGMVTEKDIVKKVVSKGLSTDKMTVGDIMSVELYKVEASESVSNAFVKMANHGIRHILVEEQGKLVGVFSIKNYLDLEKHRIVESISKDGSL